MFAQYTILIIRRVLASRQVHYVRNEKRLPRQWRSQFLELGSNLKSKDVRIDASSIIDLFWELKKSYFQVFDVRNRCLLELYKRLRFCE